jgi:hypothetical protein
MAISLPNAHPMHLGYTAKWSKVTIDGIAIDVVIFGGYERPVNFSGQALVHIKQQCPNITYVLCNARQ